MSAYGGSNGDRIGGAGTIYMLASAKSDGDLFIDNNGFVEAWTPLTSPFAFNVTIANGAIAYPTAAMTIDNLTVADGGLLTHPSEDAGFDVTVQGDATIEAAGSISADGPRLSGGGRSGGGSQLQWLGFRGWLRWQWRWQLLRRWWRGLTDPSFSQPIWVAVADIPRMVVRVVGAIRLAVADTLLVEGNLSVNGTNGVNEGGGGSGGSLYLTVGTLDGTGSISANGGISAHATHAGNGAGWTHRGRICDQ